MSAIRGAAPVEPVLSGVCVAVVAAAVAVVLVALTRFGS